MLKAFKKIIQLSFIPMSFGLLNECLPKFLSELILIHPDINVEINLTSYFMNIPSEISPFISKVWTFDWQINDFKICTESDVILEDANILKNTSLFSFTDLKIDLPYLNSNLKNLINVKYLEICIQHDYARIQSILSQLQDELIEN